MPTLWLIRATTVSVLTSKCTHSVAHPFNRKPLKASDEASLFNESQRALFLKEPDDEEQNLSCDDYVDVDPLTRA
jgi:hypothetical protein